MKKLFANILFCVFFASPVLAQTNTATQSQSRTASLAYSKALERWHNALSSPRLRGFSFTPYFGLDPEAYYDADPQFKELNESAKALASFGANMIPWMVEQIRSDLNTMTNVVATSSGGSDTNFVKSQTTVISPIRHSYLDLNVELLFMLGGIQVGIGAPPYYGEKRREAVAGFLREWDAGVYASPDKKLREIRNGSKEDPAWKTVDYYRTFPYRRYGVYALPFLIGEIRQNNSAECFNAVLIITFHRDLYDSHYKNPRALYPTAAEKMDFIHSWWRDNQQKFDKLEALRAKIEAELKPNP